MSLDLWGMEGSSSSVLKELDDGITPLSQKRVSFTNEEWEGLFPVQLPLKGDGRMGKGLVGNGYFLKERISVFGVSNRLKNRLISSKLRPHLDLLSGLFVRK